ncbi:hypothetical protein QVD17_19055 [Tagetes erecta]|uniref:FAS1 domain-containing protein n=1 Tax=Tagetes erecta TaxID=13708 RepID=A0AAD8KNZ6_TARER|nr:hypothetical protein QVD17_19055 [Tagetes erecta]
MATHLLFSIIILITTTTATSLPPPPQYNLSSLLSTLGFHHFSTATTTITATTSTTIFAPTDASLRSCPYCSLPLLFLEHSIPGLYSSHLLSTFTFATKIQTLASSPNTSLCITITKSISNSDPNSTTLFISGVEITRPDLFNDGNFIIHGIQGYITHLSPYSCQIERMTSLSFPPIPSTTPISSTVSLQLLNDAMYNLRLREYTIVSFLIQQNLDLLLQLTSMTIFAVNDGNVFGDGEHRFVSSFKFHIVPNRSLTALELMKLPVETEMVTMSGGERLVVTVAGGGGLLVPMRINNVRVVRMSVVCNDGVVVHGIAGPFRSVRRTSMGSWLDV